MENILSRINHLPGPFFMFEAELNFKLFYKLHKIFPQYLIYKCNLNSFNDQLFPAIPF